MLVAPSSLPHTWSTPSPTTSLAEGEVHLWRATTDLEPRRMRVLSAHLSRSEIARASRFRQEKDYHRWTAARGTLREILGRLLGVPPREVQIATSPQGKPKVSLPSGSEPIDFNLSHSRDLALYAAVLDKEVGVDLEYESPIFNFLDVARHFFAPAEYDHLQRAEVARQSEFFYRLWTAKEAYLKALGCGLGIAPDRAEFSFDVKNALRLERLSETHAHGSSWIFQELNVKAGYRACLALSEPTTRLHFWDWDLAEL